MWSLATEYKSGLTNTKEADSADHRCPVQRGLHLGAAIRLPRGQGRSATSSGPASAVEEAQTLNLGGHNLPALVYQQAGNSGGLYNSAANYSLTTCPT